MNEWMQQCMLLEEDNDDLLAQLESWESRCLNAERRVAELEKALREAPHTKDCGWNSWVSRPCDCWKSRALEEQKHE